MDPSLVPSIRMSKYFLISLNLLVVYTRLIQTPRKFERVIAQVCMEVEVSRPLKSEVKSIRNARKVKYIMNVLLIMKTSQIYVMDDINFII